MVSKAILPFIFCIGYAATATAQTLQWLVKPDYQAISYQSESIFKCKKNGQVQLFDGEGKTLTPWVDSITDFSEGLALVLENDDIGLRIKGIVSESGKLTEITGDFYAYQYSYFSEHLVAVSNSEGHAGYLNDQGATQIPCHYRMARPFRKGWASVEPDKRKQQTIYINHHGKALKIEGFHKGKVIMGSSFNPAGEALVAYFGDDNAVIDTKGNVVRTYHRKGGNAPINTYDFTFDENPARIQHESRRLPRFDSEITTFHTGEAFGYKKGEKTVVPPQFSTAESFADGNAIVCQDSNYGIVKLLEGSLSGTFEGDELLVAAGKEPPVYTYTLKVPESLHEGALQVKIDAGDGNMQQVASQSNVYEFRPIVNRDSEACVMRVEVWSDGLLLLTDSLIKGVMQVSLDISTPVALAERANDEDELRIQSVITNNSDIPITVSGAFSASLGKNSQNKMGQKKTFKGKIAPKGKMEVFVDLHVVEEETARISVSVKVNQKSMGTKSATLQLKPFY